jgi:hypothetical protein
MRRKERFIEWKKEQVIEEHINKGEIKRLLDGVNLLERNGQHIVTLDGLCLYVVIKYRLCM